MSASTVAARVTRALALCMLLLGCIALPGRTQVPPLTEQQVKAGFVFNLSHFVDWPADSFTTTTEPFVIGVLGGDSFATDLEEAVRDEQLEAHPLVVQRLRGPEAIPDCRILYIDRSLGGDIEHILVQLQPRGTLTVSDYVGAAGHGVAIELASDNNRVHLVINAQSAQQAGLTISSNLLRLARPENSD